MARKGRGARGIEDDEELVDVLRELSRRHGLSFVNLTNPGGLEDQVRLFANAKVIFGIHGAGFTNLIYCPEDCVVVEVPDTNHAIKLFQELSEMVGLEYHALTPQCKY